MVHTVPNGPTLGFPLNLISIIQVKQQNLLFETEWTLDSISIYIMKRTSAIMPIQQIKMSEEAIIQRPNIFIQFFLGSEHNLQLGCSVRPVKLKKQNKQDWQSQQQRH